MGITTILHQLQDAHFSQFSTSDVRMYLSISGMLKFNWQRVFSFLSLVTDKVIMAITIDGIRLNEIC